MALGVGLRRRLTECGPLWFRPWRPAFVSVPWGTLGRVSTELEIGRGKRGRRAYSLDDVAVIPSRRTRDPRDVSLQWQIDAFQFDLPYLAAPMDSVVSPATAIALGRLGMLGVLDLEGLWTRYEDPLSLIHI